MSRVILLLLCLAPFVPAQAKHPFTFEEMMALKRISDPAVSPDGKWVMFSAVDVSLAENTRKSHLWVSPVSGGEARQITNSPAGETRGRFSPDGKRILFVSARDGGPQIWLSDFDPANGALSGESTKLTTISTEADGAQWTPDGASIIFTSSVYPECSDDACNKERDDARAKSKIKASVFTRLFYRHWSSYTQFKRSHIFVVPAAGGTPKDLTPGDHDVPPFSLGGQDMYAVSPDGKELAYTSNIDEVEATSTNNEIFVVPINGGQPKRISVAKGSDSVPLYSPDGKWIAWRSQARNGYESDRFQLTLYDRSSGKLKDLTPTWDHWVEAMAWSLDSKNIYLTSEDKGEIPIYEIDVSGGTPRELARGSNDELNVTPDGKTLVFSRNSVKFPNEIYSLDLSAKAVSRPITHINDAVFAQVEMPEMESFWFPGALNVKVQGFIIRPPNFDANKKYPVKFLIHGGPQGQWGDEWTFRWNAELFAASGYVVIQINPRGSTGYGQKFIDDINGDWGGKPYIDLMRGLDFAEAKYPFIDKSRECALGASYGGYMVNWILGHNDRFKCIVSHDGMFNTESAYGDTEELYFMEWEFKGTPWSNRELYRKWSPALSAQNFKTPTLVVHGQLDYRLDVSQGFELFTTLQRLKVPSKMLYFPDEGHWVLKPQNSQLWYKTVNAWVDEYAKKP